MVLRVEREEGLMYVSFEMGWSDGHRAAAPRAAGFGSLAA